MDSLIEEYRRKSSPIMRCDPIYFLHGPNLKPMVIHSSPWFCAPGKFIHGHTVDVDVDSLYMHVVSHGSGASFRFSSVGVKGLMSIFEPMLLEESVFRNTTRSCGIMISEELDSLSVASGVDLSHFHLKCLPADCGMCAAGRSSSCLSGIASYLPATGQ